MDINYKLISVLNEHIGDYVAKSIGTEVESQINDLDLDEKFAEFVKYSGDLESHIEDYLNYHYDFESAVGELIDDKVHSQIADYDFTDVAQCLLDNYNTTGGYRGCSTATAFNNAVIGVIQGAFDEVNNSNSQAIEIRESFENIVAGIIRKTFRDEIDQAVKEVIGKAFGFADNTPAPPVINQFETYTETYTF